MKLPLLPHDLARKGAPCGGHQGGNDSHLSEIIPREDCNREGETGFPKGLQGMKSSFIGKANGAHLRRA